MAIAVGDILRITAELSRAGVDDIINVYHFRMDVINPGGDAVIMGEITAFLEDAYTIINSDIPVNVLYDSVSGINVTKNELLPSQSWPVLTAGTNVGVALPNQVSACVFWRTLRPKTRTAKFLPFYTQGANVGNGTIVAAVIVRMQSYGDQFVGPIVEGLSTFTYGAFNKGLARFTPVIQRVAAGVFRTQRRRRIGVGS